MDELKSVSANAETAIVANAAYSDGYAAGFNGDFAYSGKFRHISAAYDRGYADGCKARGAALECKSHEDLAANFPGSLTKENER